MATKTTDYLQALKDYSSGGGKSIEDFLAQHTTAQPAAPGVVNPAATPSQPSSVAARLAAADSRDRLGLSPSTAPGGNVITRSALSPITAESDALAARIQARNTPGGIVVQPAGTPAGGGAADFAPTPRRLAPTFDSSQATASVGAQPAPEATPWWQKSSFDKGFQTFVDQNNSQATGRAERDNSFVRINKNTYIPATQNYNKNSSL